MPKWIPIQKEQPRQGQEVFAKVGSYHECVFTAPDGRMEAVAVNGQPIKAWRPVTQLDVILQRALVRASEQEYYAIYESFLRNVPKSLRIYLISEVPEVPNELMPLPETPKEADND